MCTLASDAVKERYAISLFHLQAQNKAEKSMRISRMPFSVWHLENVAQFSLSISSRYTATQMNLIRDTNTTHISRERKREREARALPEINNSNWHKCIF